MMTTKFNERLNEHSGCVSQSKQGGKSTSEGGKNGVGRREQMKRDRCMNDLDEVPSGTALVPPTPHESRFTSKFPPCCLL